MDNNQTLPALPKTVTLNVTGQEAVAIIQAVAATPTGSGMFPVYEKLARQFDLQLQREQASKKTKTNSKEDTSKIIKLNQE